VLTTRNKVVDYSKDNFYVDKVVSKLLEKSHLIEERIEKATVVLAKRTKNAVKLIGDLGMTATIGAGEWGFTVSLMLIQHYNSTFDEPNILVKYGSGFHKDFKSSNSLTAISISDNPTILSGPPLKDEDWEDVTSMIIANRKNLIKYWSGDENTDTYSILKTIAKRRVFLLLEAY
jgi:hypothetical protein